MAEENRKILIDIEIAGKEAIDTIIQTTDELENLNKQLEFAKATKKYAVPESEDYKKAKEDIALLTAAQKDLNKTLNAAKKEVQDNIDKNKELGDSLNDERKKLKNLIFEFDNLSAAERDAAPGKQLLDQITEQTKKVTDLEVATGRHQRLVGSYKEAIKDASTQMGELSEGLNGLGIAGGKSVFNFSRLGKVFTSLASNPWFVVITLFANIMTKVTDAVKKNESAMSAFNKVGEIASGIWSSVEVVFEKLADWLGVAVNKLVEWAGKLGLVTEEQSDFNKAQKEMIDKQKEAVKGIQSEIGEVKLLKQAVKDSNLSYEQRKAALDKLKKIVPDYHASLTKEGKLVSDNTIAIDNYIKSLKKKAEAEAKYEVLKGYYAELEQINGVMTELAEVNKTKDLKAAGALYDRIKEEFGSWEKMLSRLDTLTKLTEEFKIEIPIEPVVKDKSGKGTTDTVKKLLTDVKEQVSKFQSDNIGEIRDFYNKQIAELQKKLETDKKLTTAQQKEIQLQIVELNKEKDKAIKAANSSLTKYFEKLDEDQIKSNIEKNKKILSDSKASYEQQEAALRENIDNQNKLAEKQYQDNINRINSEAYSRINSLDTTAENYQELYDKIEQYRSAAISEAEDQFTSAFTSEEKLLNLIDELKKKTSKSTVSKIVFGADNIKGVKTELEAYQAVIDEAYRKGEISAKKHYDLMTDTTKEAAKRQSTIWLDNAITIGSSFDSLIGSVSELYGALADNQKEESKLAKTLAYIQIWTQAGVATMTGIATAMNEKTLAGKIAAIAAVLAAVTSAVATSINYADKADNYATGGLIGGRTAISNEEGTRDDVPINASRGEYVIQAAKVKEYGVGFFDAINGNGHLSIGNNFASGGLVQTPIIPISQSHDIDYDTLIDGFASAVKEMPSPVVSVRDMADGIDKLNIKKVKARK